ncbi:glycosyl hydrolase family 28-related protein [Sphingobacterium oryzagri]|uniref:Glycosyl hydrolase family 28-related protein n=1 Tax=Sphingobacterium oryzagri TaxID=3025669 RepID=A0ABY7WJ14_9SPHI|nr:glycosyl hydrolase family 28-related protein [Sphingobacterium sp. KACC 22765]WDF68970.1 glycosyl hydrolase family 28-related protein [Sphingobacterium sp. KACC 22765]
MMNNCLYKWVFVLAVLFSLGCQGQTRTAESAKYLVSVADFGAKGDGKTDDSQAFQSAVAICEKEGQKTLYIPFGNYLLKKPVKFKKGGIQIIGTGALLREESWLEAISKSFDPAIAANGSVVTIPNNSVGFQFEETVGDPIRIADIHLKTQSGRKPGQSVGVLFSSEFTGPTWPIIVERCHFTGFNFAFKFSSKNQYNSAFVQFRQNAFNRNDECIYFDDLKEPTSAGQRNLAWGFTFDNNVCHDNSRVIRGSFGKDAVNIRDNNLEGNVAYANGKNPPFIIDIEVSNATVNFEGNHFESIVSDAVYISSVFKNTDGNYLPVTGTTALGAKNKVFIKGNNFDGVSAAYKPFWLKGLLVYNYDQFNIFAEECDFRVNEANDPNIFVPEQVFNNSGTTIKFPIKSSLSQLADVKAVKADYTKAIDAKQRNPRQKSHFLVDKGSELSKLAENGKYKDISAGTKYLGIRLEILNENGSGFFGLHTVFVTTYKIDGKSYAVTQIAPGNYGYAPGLNAQLSIVPNILPDNAEETKFYAYPSINQDIVGDKVLSLSKSFELFTISSSIPYVKDNMLF